VRSDYHRVRRGETLYSIAWKNGLDFPQLASWNQIAPPYTIYPGQRLRLRPPPTVRAAKKSADRQNVTGKQAAKRENSDASSNSTNKLASRPSISPRDADKGAKTLPSRKLQWQWPIKGPIVQGFSGRDPTRKGLKIDGRIGQPVHAAESGKVVYSGSGLIGYGQLIIIKHDKDYLSAYGHNRKLLVKEGDEVSRGERIAEVGVAGGGKSVLHFEIRRKGQPVDPQQLLPRLR
jgi:lipoprotein NlpD